MLQQQIADRLDIVEVDHRDLRLRQCDVGSDGDDTRIVGMKKRLAVLLAVDLQLRECIALEALDQNEIDRRHLAEQILQALDAAVRNGHAMAEAGRVEALAIRSDGAGAVDNVVPAVAIDIADAEGVALDAGAGAFAADSVGS